MTAVVQTTPRGLQATPGLMARLLLLVSLAAMLSGCWWNDDSKKKLKVVTEPADATVVVGSTATFSVQVNTSKVTYQWRKNGTNIAGAVSASYTTPATTVADNGATFSVVATSGNKTIMSRDAKLTVNAPPAITTQPASVTVSSGATASFSVVATGSPAPSYQWRRNGTNITGATSANYTTPATTPADDGAQFSVVVTNSAGSVTSASATLTVNSAPTITTQPANLTVNAGQTATFSVVATGSGTLAYQWRRNGADVAGATAASYTTPATTGADSGAQFAVVVSNASGSVTSATATLTVASPPPAGAWGNTQALEAAPQMATEVSTAISRETGDGVVVWTQSPDGVVNGVYANFYDAGTGTWGGPTQLVATSGTRETVYYPKAAINSSGDIVVAWMQNINQSTGNLGTIRARRFKPGEGWSEVFQLTRLPYGPEATITWTNDVDVDMDFGGNATVVWSEEYGNLGISLMSAARLPASGSFQTAELLDSSANSADAEWPHVAMDSAGNTIAVWSRRKLNSAGWQIVVRRRPANGTWGDEVILADAPTGARTENPDIAVNPATGDALVAWRDRSAASGSVYELRFSRYIAALSTWTPSAPAETDTNNIGWVSVAANKLGQGVIAWERYNTTSDVRAVRVDLASGTLGAEIAVAGGADLPSVGIDINGHIMAVFKQSDGFRPRTSARRLLADGTADVIVRLSSPSIYSDFGTVAVADDGTAVSAWMEGNLQNGLYTSGDIFGRVFR